MGTQLQAEHSAVVRFEPRRVVSPPPIQGEPRGELVPFPNPALRRNRQGGAPNRGRRPNDPQVGAAGLFDAVLEANTRAMQLLFPLPSPAELVEMQQRAGRDYMTVISDTNVALLGAVTRFCLSLIAPTHSIARQADGIAPTTGTYRTAAE